MRIHNFCKFWNLSIPFKSIAVMASCAADDKCLDESTPKNVHLRAIYKRSFAYKTVNERMPRILQQIIYSLIQDEIEICSHSVSFEKSKEDFKKVIWELNRLKYEIENDVPLKSLEGISKDLDDYNRYLKAQQESEPKVSWFNSIWLLAECYMYRRIRLAFEQSKTLSNYDPFWKQKKMSYYQSLDAIIVLAQRLKKVLDNNLNPTKSEFTEFLKMSLWGNRGDLSLTDGAVKSVEPINVEKLNKYLVVDHTHSIWNAIIDENIQSYTIDIVFDNAGFELFSDLCLADYLISKNLATMIRFYVKSFPWFISDVMVSDFVWLIEKLEQQQVPVLRELGKKWRKYLDSGDWEICINDFWTMPFDYSQMKSIKPNLYEQLSESKLIIFKGDLNYRKLFGEINWPANTPLQNGLQGFRPANLCTLRTIKSEIVCGLEKEMSGKDMVTGVYALIQYVPK